MVAIASAPAAPPPRAAPDVASGEQDSLPSRYRWPVQVLSLAAFGLAFLGWLNETWLFWFDNPVWLDRYTEYAVILAFGVWRIAAEKNAYTRRRLTILVAVVTGFWWLVPRLTPFYEPHVGYLWSQPVFPSLHVPGTLTFFLVLGLVFLFGRRVVCGYGCPCVGIRETVGFPFRDATRRSAWAWRLRHTKWLFFVWYAGVLVVTQYPPNAWTLSFVGGFTLVVALTYFGTFFVAPFVGNRFYCRYLCPYGATFGLLNHAGFYDVRMDTARCIDCGRCTAACDMGIPVWQQGKAAGRITGLEDCMGCGRCVVSCPTDALEIRDVRNLLRPALRQDASHLLKRAASPVMPSRLDESDDRPALARIAAEASRCLDCGVPACRRACPLGNRIPEWLGLAARGRLNDAADAMQSTSPLPEICGALCPQDRLCEGACALVKLGHDPVAIGAIEQAVVEEALARGWRPVLAPRKRSTRRAAVVGAGPAGLAFADTLNRMGWQVTVYDRETAIGGMLATGLPPFRFDKRALDRRRDLWEQAGIRFELGVDVDARRYTALVARNDAVFLGFGARAPRDVPLPGRDRWGVVDALDFLAGVNRGERDERITGRRVVVLGGGETALDCARAALRLGAARVTVAYRGGAERLHANAQERGEAEREGVEFRFHHAPLSIEGEAVVRGLRLRVAGEEGTDDRTLACDAVIVAFGQRASAPAWLAGAGVTLDQGTIRADAHGRTSVAGVYAGGDCAHGPDLIVTAAAAGRAAARAAQADRRRANRRVTVTASYGAPPVEVTA